MNQQSMDTQQTMTAEKMDMALFNKVYEENRSKDVYDEGYGDWMNKGVSEGQDTSKLYNGKFNKDMFHNEFETYKSKQKSTEMKLYEPEQSISYSGKSSITVLGDNKVSDFSGESAGGLSYRDYKDAYTNSCLIDSRSVDISRRDTSIDERERSREEVQYSMSEREAQMYHQQELKEQDGERKRIERLKVFDRKAEDTYSKVHQRLLGR